MKELHSSNSISSGSGGRKQGAAAAPCAACKLLRRRCAQDCVFAPYFPADEPQKFANVHKVFGASNVNKMLQELEEEQRGDAASSMVYEANARVRDPVYGCVRVISSLQQQLDVLQTQLAVAQAEVIHLRIRQGFTALATVPGTTTTTHNHDHNHNHHAHLHNINVDDTNTSSPSHSPSSASRLHTSKSLSLSPTIDMNMMLVDQQPNINMGVSLWSC